MTIFKRFRVIALALALAVVMPAMAQFKIGPRVGINVNSLHFNSELFNEENRAGFTGGLQVEFTVPLVGIGMDASVMYVKRNAEYMSTLDKNDGVKKTHSDYIEIPLNFKYKLSIPAIGSIIKPYVFTGPSFAFLTSKKDVNAFFKKKSCDVAWNFGLGVELISHLQIGASYGLGMTKALQTVGVHGDAANIDGKNRYWTVTAAWLF